MDIPTAKDAPAAEVVGGWVVTTSLDAAPEVMLKALDVAGVSTGLLVAPSV